MNFTPTPEQESALELFLKGSSLAIEAGAGTGKTSTLQLLASKASGRGQYIAFNKAIVTEATAKMPRNVQCRTAHSLAFQAVGRTYKHRLQSTARMRSDEIARHLGIGAMSVKYHDDQRMFLPGRLAGLVMQAIKRFCQSGDPEPTKKHVPYILGIDDVGEDGKRLYGNNDQVRGHLEGHIKKAWADILNPNGVLRYEHDHYLKTWQLQGPRIDADFILFDEAQDANPVLLAIVQAQRDAQIVWVGDSCQPAGTMVACVQGKGTRGASTSIENVPIEQLKIGTRVVTYEIRSGHLFRRGREVTGVTARPFKGQLLRATIADGKTSAYTPNHRCVVRIGNCLDSKHVVYLMRRGKDFRIGRTMGQHRKQGDRLGISLRGRQEGADAVWIIGVFASAAEASEQEATLSWSYGIPTLTFRWVSGVLDQESLDRFWRRNGDNADGVARLLTELGLSVDWPFWSFADGNLLRRRPLILRAANLLDGMEMLPASPDAVAYGKKHLPKFWKPITVTREEHDGPVWSLEVEDHHTYVADGIVTANCQQIYEFTGAINAMANVSADARTFLTQSFRFGQPVADVANQVLEMLRADLRLIGSPAIASTVGPVASPDAMLFRTNAAAVRAALAAQKERKLVHIIGGAADVVSFTKAAMALQRGQRTDHPELSCFGNWYEVQEYVDRDPLGEELRLLVSLIEEFKGEVILEALGRCVQPDYAELVLSTAHKAKGLEWGAVKLGSDFMPKPTEGETKPVLSPAELRLLYVAITRAKYELDVESLRVLLGTPAQV